MTDQAKVDVVEALLGFNLKAGGRRFGEMDLTLMNSGSLYIQMPGSLITLEQALAISAVLKIDDPNECPGCHARPGEKNTDHCPVILRRGQVEGGTKPGVKARKR